MVVVVVDVLVVDVVVVVVVVVVLVVVLVAAVVDAVVGDAVVADDDAGSSPVASSPDPHATAVNETATMTAADQSERFTTIDGIGPRGWHTGAVGVAGGRLLLGTGVTLVLAASAASCGTDGPTTELERGEAIYAANCAQCHGGDLIGSDRGPSLLDPMYGTDQLTDVEFADAVRNGVEQRLWDFGDMPGNGSYTDAQVAAILTFVRAQQADDPAG